MNHRLVCYIERDVFASIDDIKIIQCYQKMRKQKGLLPRALRDNGIFSCKISYEQLILVYVQCLNFKYSILCLQLQVLLLLLVKKQLPRIKQASLIWYQTMFAKMHFVKLFVLSNFLSW